MTNEEFDTFLRMALELARRTPSYADFKKILASMLIDKEERAKQLEMFDK